MWAMLQHKDRRANLQEAFGYQVKASGLHLRGKAQALKDLKQGREGIRSIFQKGNSGGCVEGGTKPRVLQVGGGQRLTA